MQETTIIGINQARANIDAGPYGPKSKPASGAFAWKHGQLASIEFSRGQQLKSDGKIVGKEIRWKLTKGKAGTHDGKSGQFDYYHVNRNEPVFWESIINAPELIGVDVISDAIDVAKKMGIIRPTGAWLKWFAGDEVMLTVNGAEKLATALLDDPELLATLRDQCIRESGLLIKYQ